MPTVTASKRADSEAGRSCDGDLASPFRGRLRPISPPTTISVALIRWPPVLLLEGCRWRHPFPVVLQHGHRLRERVPRSGERTRRWPSRPPNREGAYDHPPMIASPRTSGACPAGNPSPVHAHVALDQPVVSRVTVGGVIFSGAKPAARDEHQRTKKLEMEAPVIYGHLETARPSRSPWRFTRSSARIHPSPWSLVPGFGPTWTPVSVGEHLVSIERGGAVPSRP